MAEKKVAHGVVALSSAAVLAIYGAGYARTREAADRFAQQAADRRAHIPAPAAAGGVEPGGAPLAAPTALQPERNPPTPADVAPGPEEKPVVPPRPETAPAADAQTGTPEPLVATNPDVPSVPAGEQPTQAADAAPPTAPPPSVTPAPVSADPAKPAYKDGTYYGWGTSRHGDIQAEVVIEEGRIVLARVEKCQTRWSCNWVTPIPPVILKKQATTYDYVSGATESSDAFQGAVAEALSQAK